MPIFSIAVLIFWWAEPINFGFYRRISIAFAFIDDILAVAALFVVDVLAVYEFKTYAFYLIFAAVVDSSE